MRVHASACEAGSDFRSVLRYFGIILQDDTLAQTHGQDHPEELEKKEVVDLVIRVETEQWSAYLKIKTRVDSFPSKPRGTI